MRKRTFLAEPLQNLETRLRGFLLEHEYYAMPEFGQYRQSFEDGFFAIILAATTYPDKTLCEVHLGVRLDRIENLVYPFTNGTRSFAEHSMTLITPLARLAGQDHLRYELFDPASATSALEDIQERLSQAGLDFLEEHSDLDSMDLLYNEESDRVAYLTHNRLNRCLRAITLARLSGREEYPDIVKACRRELREHFELPERLRRFDELARLLLRYCEN